MMLVPMPGLRDRLVLEDSNPGVRERGAHARAVEPPVVVAQHGGQAVACAQAGQPLCDRLRRYEAPAGPAADHEVAQQDHEVRPLVVGPGHDGLEMVEAVAERADMQVGEHGDAQGGRAGRPA
jgi:hypothetical protein